MSELSSSDKARLTIEDLWRIRRELERDIGVWSLPCQPMTKKQVRKMAKPGLTYKGPTID